MAKHMQAWEPDTHNARFVTEWDDEDPETHVCVEAQMNGEPVRDDLQGAYEKALAENRKKNAAVAIIRDNLPEHMTKPVLDEDGDDTGRRVVKSKHRPAFTVADGQVTISVPGADPDLVALLGEKVGEHAKVIRHEEP